MLLQNLAFILLTVVSIVMFACSFGKIYISSDMSRDSAIEMR